MKNLNRIAFVLLASFAIHNSQAQSGDSTLKGMNWRNIGPNRGGRSLGVAGSSKNKLEYYFGAVGGGLWKTTDGSYKVFDGLKAELAIQINQLNKQLAQAKM